jgi:hypothetical protein
LKYAGASQSNNFVAFKKALVTYCGAEYGLLSSLLETNVYYVPEMVVVPEPETLTPANDPHGVAVDAFRDKCKSRRRQVQAMEDDRIKLFSTIYGQLSIESEERLKQDAGFDTLYAERDPLKLWILISKSHLSSSSGHVTRDRKRARDDYASLRQGSDESIVAYKERFSSQLLILQAVGEGLPDNEFQALDFIQSLDDTKYIGLKACLDNSVVTGTGVYPVTLNEAYNMASRYVVVSKSGSLKEASSASVFVADSTQKKAKFEKKQPDKGQKHANPKEKQAKGKSAKEAKKPIVNGNCKLCGEEGHYVTTCPYLENAKSFVKSKTNPTKEKETEALITNFEKFAFVADAIICKATTKERCTYDVALDTGASYGIFRESNLLSNIRKSANPLTVSGVGGKITVSEEGDVEHFGPVAFSQHVPINILSFSDVAKMYNVTYNADKDKFTVHVSKDIKYDFIMDNGLYLSNMANARAAHTNCHNGW